MNAASLFPRAVMTKTAPRSTKAIVSTSCFIIPGEDMERAAGWRPGPEYLGGRWALREADDADCGIMYPVSEHRSPMFPMSSPQPLWCDGLGHSASNASK